MTRRGQRTLNTHFDANAREVKEEKGKSLAVVPLLNHSTYLKHSPLIWSDPDLTSVTTTPTIATN